MDNITQEVEKILDEIRPSLQNHGGDARLREVKDGDVYLELKGACEGCPMAVATFGVMVQEMIKEKLPQIKDVIYE